VVVVCVCIRESPARPPPLSLCRLTNCWYPRTAHPSTSTHALNGSIDLSSQTLFIPKQGGGAAAANARRRRAGLRGRWSGGVGGGSVGCCCCCCLSGVGRAGGADAANMYVWVCVLVLLCSWFGWGGGYWGDWTMYGRRRRRRRGGEAAACPFAAMLRGAHTARLCSR
jgi:hypothetical protein